jgi:N-acetylglutamate synthase-like GNAT family acetyltransferase
MKIRPVEKKDVPQIVKLVGDVWAEYECVLDTEKEETYLLDPGEYFHARDGEFWVVVEKNAVVATVAVQLLGEKTAELRSLYVRKDFRRQGLGENLTTLAVKYAQMKGSKEIILWSDTRFAEAHRLYRRLGFKQVSSRELDDLNKSKEYGFKRNI